MDNLLRSVFGVAAFFVYLFFTAKFILPLVFGKWVKKAPNQAKTSVFMLVFILVFLLGGYFIGLYFFPALFKIPTTINPLLTKSRRV
ncbi:MAG TPA: hypothetical protein VN963_02565 [bacterium]|nr:hypothetical protein [bacterium]